MPQRPFFPQSGQLGTHNDEMLTLTGPGCQPNPLDNGRPLCYNALMLEQMFQSNPML